MNLVPGNNVVTKTGFLSLVTGLTAYGISKEVIILHNESLIVVSTGIVLALAYKKLSGPFEEWANSEREVRDPFLSFSFFQFNSLRFNLNPTCPSRLPRTELNQMSPILSRESVCVREIVF